MARNEKITDLMDFLHKVENYVQTGRDHHDITKTECLEIKEILHAFANCFGSGKKQHSGIVIPEGYTLISCKELETMQYELQNQREAIEELTSRWLRDRLKEGNPNIADLSDKNRPTKFGEYFASLYDDEWSEALEEMGEEEEQANEDKKNLSSDGSNKEEDTDDDEDEVESKSIQKLLDVVKLAYKFCGDEATAQLHKIANGMKDSVSLAPSVRNSTTLHKYRSPTPTGTKAAEVKKDKPKETANIVESETWSIALRSAQSFRKDTALNVVPQIKQLFRDFYIKEMKLESAASLPEALGKYIDRCVELTWLMSVQDPPMEIKWVENGARSDTNYFKFYLSKGKMVKQCVWPAVFLSAQGGIVSKGAFIGMAPPKDT